MNNLPTDELSASAHRDAVMPVQEARTQDPTPTPSDRLSDAVHRAARMHDSLTQAASGLTDHVAVDVLLQAAAFCARAEAIATRHYSKVTTERSHRPDQAQEASIACEIVDKATTSAENILRRLGLAAARL